MNAKSLLKIEFIKLRKQTYFWVIAAFIIVFFSLITFKFATLNLKVSFLFPNSNDIVTSKFFIFPNIWQTIAWIASWFNHFLAFLIIIYVSNEFTNKTYRQLVVSGMKKSQLINSKILVIFLLPILLFILILIFSIIFGNVYTANKNICIFSGSIYLFTYYLQAISYMLIALLLVLIFKKPGISIMMYINLLLLEFTFRFWLTTTTLKSIIYFLPIKAISLLTPRPSSNICLRESTALQFHINDLTTPKPLILIVSISIIYAILFYVFSILIIKRKSL